MLEFYEFFLPLHYCDYLFFCLVGLLGLTVLCGFSTIEVHTMTPGCTIYRPVKSQAIPVRLTGIYCTFWQKSFDLLFFLPLIFENFQESHTRRLSNLNLNIFFCNEKLRNDKPQIKHNLLDLLTEKTGKSSLWHLHPTIVYITRTLTLYDQNHMLIIK